MPTGGSSPLPVSLGKQPVALLLAIIAEGHTSVKSLDSRKKNEEKKKGRSYVTSGCELAGVQESCCTKARKLGQRRAQGRMCPQLPLTDDGRCAEEEPEITRDT